MAANRGKATVQIAADLLRGAASQKQTGHAAFISYEGTANTVLFASGTIDQRVRPFPDFVNEKTMFP